MGERLTLLEKMSRFSISKDERFNGGPDSDLNADEVFHVYSTALMFIRERSLRTQEEKKILGLELERERYEERKRSLFESGLNRSEIADLDRRSEAFYDIASGFRPLESEKWNKR